MKKFTLPDQLPATVAELDELATQAAAEIAVLQARANAGEELSAEDTDRLEYLLDSRDTLVEERASVDEADANRAEKLNTLLTRAAAKPEAPAEPAQVEADAPVDEAAAAEVVAEAEQVAADAAERETVTAGARKTTEFAGAVTHSDVPTTTPGDDTPGWELLPSAPKYAEFATDGAPKVTIREIADSILSVKPGQSSGRHKTGLVTRGGKDFASQAVARLPRPRKDHEITTGQELLAELDRIAPMNPGQARNQRMQALTAAGGWQAPSEQVYTFCKVPPAVNLISLPEPEGNLSRGGIRYPIESDMSSLLTDFAFQFHFTETQLEAVDGGGEPTAIKAWSEIPGVDSFLEFRLSVLGYAVKVGILHQQGWPESVAHDIERLMVRHQHGISWRTINEMVSGSGAVKVVPTATILGTTSSVLNGLALQALNLRLDKGLDVDAPIEGVAPVWLKEVIRADITLRDGLDALYVSDEQINDFLVRRNIYLQYVDDWQTRSSGKPGNMLTDRWPGYADVLLYPAGTWFRHLAPVITFGVQYPMELLAKNQYSHAFFEDSIAVGKRCDKSINVRLPLCTNGAVGAREEIVCSYSGATTLTRTITITGTPSGGTFKLKFSANGVASGTINHNASAADVKTALVAIDDSFTTAHFTTTGGALPGTAVVVTYPAELGELTVDSPSLSGGTDPAVTIS